MSISEETTHTHETIAEAIGEFYSGEIVQVYFGETGRTRHYAEESIEQKIYIEGKVLWAQGNVFMLGCEITTPTGTYTKEVMINAWGVLCVMKKNQADNIDIPWVIQKAVNK